MSTVLEHFSGQPDDTPRGLRLVPDLVRAGIYVRISSDRTGAGLGVARQEEDCRALCERAGWPVHRVYVDNDVSAYSGKPRPAWQELMGDVTAGLVTAVVCWHVDRLTRSPRELEEVIDLHDKRGVTLATVTGEMDLSSPTGRMLARMLGAAARHEAEHQAERRRRAGLQKAKAGLPHPSGRRGYGYERDSVTIVPAEAAILREAKDRAMAGETPRSIAADLNHRGVPSATGQNWSAEALRKMLTSARISGRRERHGQIMHDQSWDAIITPNESDQLRLRLARRPGMPPPHSRRYLMSGIFTCGLCESGLYGHPWKPGQLRYVCVKEPGHPGCGKVTIMAGPADERARNVILTALDSSEFFAALMTADTPAGDITARLVALDAQRDQLARDYAARVMTRSEWLTAREQLTAEADSLTAALSRTQHAATLARFAALPGTPWQKWDGFTTGARRALVRACAAGIPVRPATSRRWDPSRIGDPLWRI